MSDLIMTSNPLKCLMCYFAVAKVIGKSKCYN